MIKIRIFHYFLCIPLYLRGEVFPDGIRSKRLPEQSAGCIYDNNGHRQCTRRRLESAPPESTLGSSSAREESLAEVESTRRGNLVSRRRRGVGEMSGELFSAREDLSLGCLQRTITVPYLYLGISTSGICSMVAMHSGPCSLKLERVFCLGVASVDIAHPCDVDATASGI